MAATTVYIKSQIRDLSPACFALVMSTGIISIACHLLKLNVLSNVFFFLNIVQYAVLVLMLVLRIVFYTANFKKDLTTDLTGPGFLTLVAGSCVLGIQFNLLRHLFDVACILWFVAVVTWIIIVYTFLTVITIKQNKPALAQSLNGGWLLFTVSTQALAILGTQLLGHLPVDPGLHLFITLAAYFLGFFFYLLLISIVFFRLAFDPLSPAELTPPYWVMMGAAAISALSGATLIQAINKCHLYYDLLPVLKGLTLMMWIVASWWIPLLLILEIWRYCIKKFPVKYTAANWDTVFTLGMYTACTFNSAGALQSVFLTSISAVFIYVAVIVWLITFVLMAGKLVKEVGVS